MIDRPRRRQCAQFVNLSDRGGALLPSVLPNPLADGLCFEVDCRIARLEIHWLKRLRDRGRAIRMNPNGGGRASHRADVMTGHHYQNFHRGFAGAGTAAGGAACVAH